MGNKIVLFKSSKGYAWNKICSFVCLKDTNEEKLEKLFFLWSSKKQICPFWRPIKIELSIFFLVIVLWSKRKVFTNFQKRIFNLRSLWFFNWKLSRACKCSQICRFLGIGQKNGKKYYITPPYCITSEPLGSQVYQREDNSLPTHGPELKPYHWHLSNSTVIPSRACLVPEHSGKRGGILSVKTVCQHHRA